MKPFLIVASILPSILASAQELPSSPDNSIPPSVPALTLNPRSLFDSILFNLPRSNGGLDQIKSFLTNFHPVRDAHYVSIMLQYRKFPYQKFYELITESPEQQIQLFEDLFNPTNENNSHETFFSPRKLQNSPELARKIFLGVGPVVYKGRLFALESYFQFDVLYGKSEELAMTVFRFGIMEQMDMVDNLDWLDCFLKIAKEDHVHEIFKLFLDRREMTPGIFGSFINHRAMKKGESLVNHYLYPDPTLPHDELLMRCILLSSMELSEFYAECKGRGPYDNLKELQRIALERGDRQSISILFYFKFEYQRYSLEASEMLGYVKLGGLSPITTEKFVKWAFNEGAEFGDWPLEHLQVRLSLTSRRISKEDRLAGWLCSDSLLYEHVGTISIDDLYNRPGDMSINMRLTEPVEMKDGRIVTRVAEYLILNAQAILDTHQRDQQTPKGTSVEDCRRIVAGTLYALAEGRHLDFTNTKAEMREDDERWDWFGRHAGFIGYGNEVRIVQGYLSSVEIYELVHRASPRQYVQDEQVAEVGEGIARL